VVLVTFGTQGVVVTEKDAISLVITVVVADVVVTTGAGETFSTSLIAGMSEDLDWRQAARKAVQWLL
jgi:sugar/nucleoside kinase (ribokinase family)